MVWRLTSGPAVIVAGLRLASAVAAQTPVPVNARVEISAAVVGASPTLEALERQANARDRLRQREIAALQARLAEAQTQGAAEVAQLQLQLVEAREALVSDLAARDPAYAAEIAGFRREVTDIASSPEGAAALARYNTGDRVGAISVLDRLRRARDAARQSSADLQSAAEARQIATLALDARAKSDPAFDTGAVIVRFEEVVRLDRSDYNDWFQLVQLYRAAGRNADALTAAEQLEALARDDWGRASALILSADLLLSQGDRRGALDRYERSLDLFDGLAAADPASTDLARAVSVSLERIGDVLLDEDDLVGALARFERSLENSERLAAADPASPDLARNVGLSLNKVGDVLLEQGDPEGARARYGRSLGIAERLFAANPDSIDLAGDVGVSLTKVADVGRTEGDLAGALVLYLRALEIFERLSAADPVSTDWATDVGLALEKIGDVLLLRGDRAGALARHERSLEIRRRLAAANPASADLARDVSVSLARVNHIRQRQDP